MGSKIFTVTLCCVLLIVRLLIPYAPVESNLFVLYQEWMCWIAGFWQNMVWGMLLLLLGYRSPYRFFLFLAGVESGLFVLILWGILHWCGIELLKKRPFVKRHIWWAFQILVVVLCLSYIVQFFLFHVLGSELGTSVREFVLRIGIGRVLMFHLLWIFVIYLELRKCEKLAWLWALGGLISGPLVLYLYVLKCNVLLALKNKTC